MKKVTRRKVMRSYLPAHLLSRDIWQSKISLEAYLHEGRKKMKIISCALVFEHYRSKGLLRPVKKTSPQVGLRDLHKTCECHSTEKGHTIDECIGLKNAVRYLFSMDSTPNTWGDDVNLACDEPRLDIPVTERIRFFHCSFTPFKKTMREIYLDLVQNGFFTHYYKNMDMQYSIQHEIRKCCP